MDPAVAEHLEAGLDLDLTPPEIIGDINVSPSLACHKQEILDAANVRLHLAQARQIRIRQAGDRIEKFYMDGIGARVASMDRDKAAEMKLRYGPKWFRDPKTLHEVLQRHPEIAVREPSLRKFSIRVNGLRDQKVSGAAGCGAQTALVKANAVPGRNAAPPFRSDPAKAARVFGHESPAHPNNSRRLESEPDRRIQRAAA
jgi:hypothetical protein